MQRRAAGIHPGLMVDLNHPDSAHVSWQTGRNGLAAFDLHTRTAKQEGQVLVDQSVIVLWFFLPTGLANVAPIIAAKLPRLVAWSFPLDGYATFRGKRLFGAHKTVRGLLSRAKCTHSVPSRRTLTLRAIRAISCLTTGTRAAHEQAIDPGLLSSAGGRGDCV